jgi:hypothetical protein
MRGTLTFNGWSHSFGKVLRPGLISNHYRHADTKWTAEELFRGTDRRPFAIAVKDETGSHIGIVKSVKELP